MASSKPKFVIFGDLDRKFVAEAIEDFTRFAADKAQIIGKCFKSNCPFDVLAKADWAITFGGDGTILSAARDLSNNNVPVIGVNVGKLGFLAEFSPEELKQFFDRIIAGSCETEKRMMLSCCISRGGKQRFSNTAINDVVITAGPPFSMLEIQISVDGQKLTGCISDGIIISTPTGSTAYNLSAGGPILSADLEAIVITAICPHTLSFRPIVINAAGEIRLQLPRLNEGTTLTLDGQVNTKLTTDDVICVKKHGGAFLVVNNPLRTQWDTLAGKLNWAEKPRYKNQSE